MTPQGLIRRGTSKYKPYLSQFEASKIRPRAQDAKKTIQVCVFDAYGAKLQYM